MTIPMTVIAREFARLRLVGADPTEAVTAAIQWSHDRLEFGWSHAYAGAAEWLTLFDERSGDDEVQLVCLMEVVGHIAEDILRHKTYPFARDMRKYDEDTFVNAIDDEDASIAIALLRGALDAGIEFTKLERGFARAALAHYADFGHSLIYVSKAGKLIERLGHAVAWPLLASLVRSLVYSRREERIPEFRYYATAIKEWPDSGVARASHRRRVPRPKRATGAPIDNTSWCRRSTCALPHSVDRECQQHARLRYELSGTNGALVPG